MSPTTTHRLGTALVPIALTAANAVSYLLLMLGAHLLGAAQFGTLSALLGVQLVATVPMLALQTVVARRAAAATDLAGAAAGTAVLAGSVTLLMLFATPALSAFLHLDDSLDLALIAAGIPASAVLGFATGLAQGRRRYLRLSIVSVLATAGRAGGGIVGLVLTSTPTGAVTGMLVGATAAAIGVSVRGGLTRVHFAPAAAGEMVRESLHAAHAHGAFLMLASCDVLLARHLLSPQQASVFGVGAVVTRVALWLPQTVVGVLFAGLARAHEHAATARRCAALVAGLGAATTIGTAVLGRLVVSIVGGAQFHALDSTIWLFALSGSLLSLVQVALLAGLAQRRTRQVTAIWLTLAADVALAFALSGGTSATGLAAILTGVAALSAGFAVDRLVATRRLRRPAPEWSLAPQVVTSS